MPTKHFLLSVGFAILASWGTSSFGAHGAPINTRDYAPTVRDTGPYAVSEFLEYNSAQLVVNDPEGLKYNVDVKAVVRYPLEGDGPFPVVLYLHGRHSTCSYAGITETLSTGECDIETPGLLGQPTNVLKPVESLKGYDYMANNLASHGYVVLSISANDINDKDAAGDAGVNERSQLILHHLDILREINASGQYSKLDNPYLMADLRGKIDMEHIGLMGHSRGGQGVTHVLEVNKDRGLYFELGFPEGGDFAAPHNLTAVFALAPTNFDYIAAPDTTFAVLLPYCDGDVSNLQGAFMYDKSRFLTEEKPSRKFQILTMGANHNFYNTIWTGDDYSNADPYCNLGTEGNGRDVPLDQRRHGEFLMSSFFRLFLGNEQQFAPFWNGEETMPLDACPVGTADNNPFARCDDRFHLSIQTPEGERLFVDDVVDEVSLTKNDLNGDTTQIDLDVFDFCKTESANGTVASEACPSIRTWSTAGQLYLESDNATSKLTTVLGDLDVTDFDYLTFRAGVPVLAAADGPLETEPDLAIELTDTDGNSQSLAVSAYSKALYLPPGSPSNSEGAKTMLNMVQLPLASFEGINFEHLQSLALINTGTTKLQLAEIQFQAIKGALVLPEPEPEPEPETPPQPEPEPEPEPQTEEPAPSDPPTVQPQSTDPQPIPAGGGGGALGLIGLLGLRHLLTVYRRKKQGNM